MEKIEEKTTYTVAKINNIGIQIIENGQKLVPIKPICDALGIDAKSQRERIQRDEILKSTGVMTTSVGADKKSREMLSLPFEFVFGWLFTISADRVKPEAKEKLIRYKLECYKALWQHFSGHADYVDYRQKQIDAKLDEIDTARKQFNSAKSVLDEKKKELNNWRAYSFEKFKGERDQLQIDFQEGGE